MQIITYVCPDCGHTAFSHKLGERKTWLGELLTPISFVAESNCDSCANWLHKNFHIQVGLYSTPNISVKTSRWTRKEVGEQPAPTYDSPEGPF